MQKARTKYEIATQWERHPQALFRSVHSSPELMQQLSKLAYRKNQHCLTWQQIKLIAEYFGYEVNENDN